MQRKVSQIKNTIKNAKNKLNKSSNNNLHESIAFVVILAQCFALMPVNNIIKNSDVSQIKFKWFSFKLLYSIANMAGAITLVVMNFIRYLSTGMHFGDLGTVCFNYILQKLFKKIFRITLHEYTLLICVSVTVIYFTITILTIILFIRMGYKWHDLNEKWFVVENAMRNYDYQPNLSKRFKITTCIVMFLALGTL